MDLTAIDGINVLTAQTVTSEVGYNMGQFDTEAQFVPFLNLAPNTKIGGGKVVGREKRKKRNRAGLALQQAATSLLRSESYLAYVDKGREFHEQRYRQIQLRTLQRKAAELGLQVIEAA